MHKLPADEITINSTKPPKNIAAKKYTRKNENSSYESELGKSIIIFPADKRNATVIIDTNQHKENINDLLDSQTYRIISRHTTQRKLRKTIQLI